MKTLFFLLLLMPAILQAQREGSKPVDSTSIEAARTFDRKLSKPKEGVMLPEFEAKTTGGEPFSLNQLRQHISVVAFWYPSCGCFNPDLLRPFQQFANSPRFQIVSIMPDSFNYTTFIRERPVPGIHVNMNSHAKCTELSLSSPYPSVMLIDANGKILKASNSFHKAFFDEADWLAWVREALLF